MLHFIEFDVHLKSVLSEIVLSSTVLTKTSLQQINNR